MTGRIPASERLHVGTAMVLSCSGLLRWLRLSWRFPGTGASSSAVDSTEFARPCQELPACVEIGRVRNCVAKSCGMPTRGRRAARRALAAMAVSLVRQLASGYSMGFTVGLAAISPPNALTPCPSPDQPSVGARRGEILQRNPRCQRKQDEQCGRVLGGDGRAGQIAGQEEQ